MAKRQRPNRFGPQTVTLDDLSKIIESFNRHASSSPPKTQASKDKSVKRNATPQPYFFLSFDLAGSTAFKQRNVGCWANTALKFYELVPQQFSHDAIDHRAMTVWKLLGDEVLLHRPLIYQSDIQILVPQARETQLRLTDLIRKFEENQTGRPPTLGVKAVCWIAMVGDKAAEAKAGNGRVSRNYRFELENAATDFIGPDIDTGFRVAGKFSSPNVLAITCELANFLWKRVDSEFADNCRLIGFERLKGIWNGRHYPGIWWDKTWDNSCFPNYDDALLSPYVERALRTNDGDTKKEAKAAIRQNGAMEVVDELEAAVQHLKVFEPKVAHPNSEEGLK